MLYSILKNSNAAAAREIRSPEDSVPLRRGISTHCPHWPVYRWRLVACLLAAVATTATAEARTAAVIAARTQATIDHGDAPSWWTPELPSEVQNDIRRKAQRLTQRLELKEEALTLRTVARLNEHFSRVWAWHQQVDPQLDQAWAAWDAARDNTNGRQKDELKALAIMTEQIDPIYAEFAPQVQGVLAALRKTIGAEKTTELLDRITRSPGAKRTYNAYLGMVPEMTESEQAILWNRMAQAREDCLAAWSDKRIIKIFKKYKLRNEFSLDYFGYGYRQRYEAWAKAQH